MDSKFVPGDYVKYQNHIYLVKTIILMNPSIVTDPFVCGLIPAIKSSDIRYWNQLLVRETLLVKVDPPLNNRVLEVLYGN